MKLSQVSLLAGVLGLNLCLCCMGGTEFFISPFSLQEVQIFTELKVMESDWSVFDMPVSACCGILRLTIIPHVLSMM